MLLKSVESWNKTHTNSNHVTFPICLLPSDFLESRKNTHTRSVRLLSDFCEASDTQTHRHYVLAERVFERRKAMHHTSGEQQLTRCKYIRLQRKKSLRREVLERHFVLKLILKVIKTCGYHAPPPAHIKFSPAHLIISIQVPLRCNLSSNA